jgi:hypothetical protein
MPFFFNFVDQILCHMLVIHVSDICIGISQKAVFFCNATRYP